MTDIRTKFARLGMNLTPDDARFIGMNQPDYTISFGVLSQIIDRNSNLCQKIFYDFLKRYTLNQDKSLADKNSQMESLKEAIKNSKDWYQLSTHDDTIIVNFFDSLRDFIEESAEIFDLDQMLEKVQEIFKKPLLKTKDIKNNQILLFKVFTKFRSIYNTTIRVSHGVVMNYHIEQIIVETCKAFNLTPKDKQRIIEGFCELLIGTILKYGNSDIAFKNIEVAFRNGKIHKLWSEMKAS